MKKITEIAQQMLIPCLHEDSIVADFTLGNGYDCEFLISHSPKYIYAFEIQKTVIENTKKRLDDKHKNVQFICDGHENLLRYIEEKIDAGIFNFGYCPTGDKKITTKLITSRKAVEDALSILKLRGRLVLVLYPGHPQGKEEADYFSSYVKQLDTSLYEVCKISIENRIHCPFILCIEKIRYEKEERDLSL